MDKRTLTISVLISGAFLLAASGVAFLFFGVLRGRPVTTANVNVAAVPNAPAVEPAAPVVGAEKTLSSAQCAAGAEADRDTCFDALAAQSRDAAFCSKINDEERRGRCVNFVTFLVAGSKKDPAACAPLGADLRITCEDRVFQSLAKPEDCGAFAADLSARCRDLVVSARAKTEADCAAIADASLKTDCLAAQSVLKPDATDTDKDGLTDYVEVNLTGTDPQKADTDGDGLSDGEEILRYHTDPLKADTDGDGFSDGNEVKNGYNPIGSGKMIKIP